MMSAITHLGLSYSDFPLMHKWMYGDWVKFSHDRNKNFARNIKEGFVGNTVVMNKSVLPKIGAWDERLQSADFGLYLRSKTRSNRFGDMKPIHICLGVFNHHYIRLTAKRKYPKFADFDNLIQLDDKWTEDDLRQLSELNT